MGSDRWKSNTVQMWGVGTEEQLLRNGTEVGGDWI